MTDYRDDQRPDSHTPTFTEIGAVVTLIVGCLCGAAVRVALKRWKP